MRTRTVATAVALGTTVLALAGAAACGRSPAHSGIASAGGTGSASAHPTASVDPEEQARAFAQCMREHGVDMPDPETVGGGGSGSGGVRITVTGAPGAGMDAAMNACKDKLPNGGTPPSMSPEQQEQLRAFAQCMRDHGVDMPDPDPNSGGLRISSSGGPAFGPDDPTFKAAQEACQEKLPGALSGKGGTVTNGGGDGGGPGFSVGGGK
jgi:hypothetical protein